MIKVVDIERLKNRYFHRVGTQFDNAIFVAEKEFLIDAYTKDEVIAMLEELDFRLSHYQDTDLIRQDIQEKINKLKENKK